jgi:hypothetical protein
MTTTTTLTANSSKSNSSSSSSETAATTNVVSNSSSPRNSTQTSRINNMASNLQENVSNERASPARMPLKSSTNMPCGLNEPQLSQPLLSEHQIELFKRQREREDFSRRLIEFHKHKNVNTPIYKLPCVNGTPIDMQKLYTKVASMGGWERVCEKDKWSEVALHLDKSLFSACTNGSQALKLIYVRYLSLFEKFDQQTGYTSGLCSTGASISSILDPMFTFNTQQPALAGSSLIHSSSTSVLGLNSAASGQSALTASSLSVANNLNSLAAQSSSLGSKAATSSESDHLGGLDGDGVNKKKFSYLLDSTPMVYSYQQAGAVSTSRMLVSPYENLILSLVSGFGNELDFVFNTIVILSGDEANSFKLHWAPRLVDLMLAHIGFFGTNDKYKLRYLYDNVWNKPSDLSNTTCGGSTVAEELEKYTNLDYAGQVNEIIGQLKSPKRRNFVRFWHTVIKLPANDEFNKNDTLSQLLPELYNDCKLRNLFLKI